jgi:hypothetical protein
MKSMAKSDTKRTVERPGWLENNKTFKAPARRAKKFNQVVELVRRGGSALEKARAHEIILSGW